MLATSIWTTKTLERSLQINDVYIVNKKKGKSGVWNNFGLIGHKKDDTASDVIPGFVACKYCYQVYKYTYDSGTTTLNKHIDKCMKVRPVSQPTIEREFGIGGNCREAKEKVAAAAVDFVCSDLRAFTAIEGDGMKVLAQAFIEIGYKYGKVDASKVLPCANTVKKYTMQRASSALEATKKVLKKPFAEFKLAFSTDLWTSDYRKTSYLDLTAYWIDDDFQMHSQVGFICLRLLV